MKLFMSDICDLLGCHSAGRLEVVDIQGQVVHHVKKIHQLGKHQALHPWMDRLRLFSEQIGPAVLT